MKGSGIPYQYIYHRRVMDSYIIAWHSGICLRDLSSSSFPLSCILISCRHLGKTFHASFNTRLRALLYAYTSSIISARSVRSFSLYAHTR